MVRHILKDGTELKDITGKKVKKEENPTVYELIGSIERRVNGKGSKERD